MVDNWYKLYILFVTGICHVIEEECDSILKPCVFPFAFHGDIFNECTSQFFPGNANNQKWCATQTNITNDNIEGHWGVCKETNCPGNKGK